MDKRTAVRIAVGCARHVLRFYAKKCPGDTRPRQAIEAAAKYLRTPTTAAADAAKAAAYAAANTAALAAADADDALDAYDAERKWQAARIRQLVGNPFDDAPKRRPSGRRCR
ncbi:MAG: putative immunity protein [Verrucomicrobiota bacterium]|jgi:hypothetical protein